MRLPILSLFVSVMCLIGPAVSAQHADFSPRVSAGRIVVDAFDDGGGTLERDQRIFAYDFQEDLEQPYFIGDPGFNAFAGSGLPDGSQLRFNLLTNLQYWDGSGDVAFGAAPASETLRIELGAQSRTIGFGSTPQEGFSIGTVGANGTLHRHLGTYLLGATQTTVPADGIYLLGIELASSHSGVGPSEAVYVVFNNGLSEGVHDEAIEFVGANVVPEPAGLGALGFSALALLRRRGR